MNILLINTNPVVSRLISLCLRDDSVLEEVTDVNTVVLDRYDIVFVDDASYVDGLQDVLSNFMIRKKVFLSGKNSNEESAEYFDEVIRKPFLPSQITTVIESLNEVEKETEETVTEHFIFPLATEENTIEDKIELDEPKETEVLDSSEIERIKALLEDDDLELEAIEIEDEIDYETRKVEVITQHLEADGLEIVSEEEYVEILSSKSKNKKKDKNKKYDKKNTIKKSDMKKKDKKKKEETFTFEEALIAAVEGMKVKKIKKLLKGAEVTIKINFKDKSNGKQ